MTQETTTSTGEPHTTVPTPGRLTVLAGPTAVGKGTIAAYVRTYFPDWDEPLAGAEHGEVEYEITLDEWRRQTGSR